MMPVIIEIPSPAEAPVMDLELELVMRPAERSMWQAREPAARNRIAVHNIGVDRLTEVAQDARPCALAWPDPVYSVVTARIGFLPDRGHRFTNVRVTIALGHALAAGLRPIACSMFPASELDSSKVVKSVEVTATLGVKVASVELDALKHGHSEARETTAYSYHIVTFGACSSEPAWDFRANESHPELAGDVVLVLVAASPPGVATSGEISVTAIVESVASGFRLPFVSRATDPINASKTFQLTSFR